MVQFIQKIDVYVDGACKSNPGPCAVGVVILDENREVRREVGEFAGEGTNNSAEYKAVIKALEVAPDICTLKVVVHSDSKLVVNQLNHKFRIHKEHLRQLCETVRTKQSIFKSVEYVKVPQSNKHIERADRLAKQALQRELNG